MTKCNNETCYNEATLQFDHNGKLTLYCGECFDRICTIFEAMGAFKPIAYPIGAEIKD